MNPRRMYQPFATDEISGVNRTGATVYKGYLAALDVTGSHQSVTLATYEAAVASYAETDHPLANWIKPATGHLAGWVFAVAGEEIADNATGLWVLEGVCEVLCAASSAVAAAAKITPANAVYTATALVDGQCCIGQAIDAGPTGASAALATCIFSGKSSLFGVAAEI